ncbi:MAG: cupin-like domain-containing protein [Acidiferrobacterales bacterium]|nr:cupin-like domain-containing protein [Acidiferrobacterales bacterium]
MPDTNYNFASFSVTLPKECAGADQPKLFRGLVSQWPVISQFESSNQSVLPYIASFNQGPPLTVYQAGPEANSRLFYNDTFDGFNFVRHRKTMSEVQVLLNVQLEQDSSADLLYVGSTSIKHWFPGFELQNKLDLGNREFLNSLWFGSRCLVAPHFDFPDNLAIVVAGRRTFRLYPPDQFENLYVGPFDLTPSGQPISLVDVRDPDYQRFPKFSEAERHCLEFTLEPGDAIFIPSMWWHSVESLDDFNALVNYWWRTTPSYLGSPLAAFQLAMLSFDGLEQNQKKIWQNLFKQLIFERTPETIAHIPENIQGMYKEIDKDAATKIRNTLSEILKTK